MKHSLILFFLLCFGHCTYAQENRSFSPDFGCGANLVYSQEAGLLGFDISSNVAFKIKPFMDLVHTFSYLNINSNNPEELFPVVQQNGIIVSNSILLTPFHSAKRTFYILGGTSLAYLSSTYVTRWNVYSSFDLVTGETRSWIENLGYKDNVGFYVGFHYGAAYFERITETVYLGIQVKDERFRENAFFSYGLQLKVAIK